MAVVAACGDEPVRVSLANRNSACLSGLLSLSVRSPVGPCEERVNVKSPVQRIGPAGICASIQLVATRRVVVSFAKNGA